MAAAGNVVGLRRLLGRYRQLHKAVRGRLEGRLKHEVERAQRIQVRPYLSFSALGDADSA
jgi:hypothetical protein